MKFFTMEWWLSCQRPGPRRDAAGEWRRYFEQIRPRLPASVMTLVETNLHDASLRDLHISVADAKVVMLFDGIAWDENVSRRRLTFTGTSAMQFSVDSKNGLDPLAGFGDFGYWEIDVCDEGFEYRGLFSNGIELLLRFQDVAIEDYAK